MILHDGRYSDGGVPAICIWVLRGLARSEERAEALGKGVDLVSFVCGGYCDA